MLTRIQLVCGQFVRCIALTALQDQQHLHPRLRLLLRLCHNDGLW